MSEKTITLPGDLSVNLMGHGSFGRLTPDDKLYYVLPTTSAVDMIDGWISLIRPILVAWDLDDLSKTAVSVDLEDSNWYCNAAVADVSNDGYGEMVAGTGGLRLAGSAGHACPIEGPFGSRITPAAPVALKRPV